MSTCINRNPSAVDSNVQRKRLGTSLGVIRVLNPTTREAEEAQQRRYKLGIALCTLGTLFTCGLAAYLGFGGIGSNLALVAAFCLGCVLISFVGAIETDFGPTAQICAEGIRFEQPVEDLEGRTVIFWDDFDENSNRVIIEPKLSTDRYDCTMICRLLTFDSAQDSAEIAFRARRNELHMINYAADQLNACVED